MRDIATSKKAPDLPIILIGRIAEDRRFRRQGIDEFLPNDALKRALQSWERAGCFAVTVDAIGDKAIAFYGKCDTPPMIGRPNRLYLPMASVKRLGL